MKDTIKEQFEKGGFTVEEQKGESHWKLRGHNLCIHYWPNTGSTFVYGKSFKAAPDALINAVQAGRIRLPEDAGEGACKSCGTPIWWVVSNKSGKRLPVTADGESHFASCAKAALHRKPNVAEHRATVDFYRQASGR